MRMHLTLMAVLALGMALPRVGGAESVTTGAATGTAARSPAEQLAEAERLVHVDHAQFLDALAQLHRQAPRLTAAQRWQLSYLDALRWEFAADYAKATPLLNAIVAHSGDPSLSARATSVLMQIASIGRDYQRAYELANRLMMELPRVTEPDARMAVQDRLVQMMADVGQYDLALKYARQLRSEFPSGEGQCLGRVDETQALLYAFKLTPTSPDFGARLDRTVELCRAAGQVASANALRLDQASVLVNAGDVERGIALLHRIEPSVRSAGWKPHVASLQVTLAQAYARQGDDAKASQYAERALALAEDDQASWIVQAADDVLYQTAKRGGDTAAALAYYEKYVAQDKAATDDAKARALAYQMVRQEVLAKKMQLDTLGKQNRILQLQQALSVQAQKAGRMYIAMLLALVGFITLALCWLWRSRLHFRRIARHDSLTGAFNRGHFLELGEASLHRLRKARGRVCLAILDLDHFKQVNDTHGHVAGDVVLRQALAVVARGLRPADILGRLGGEEFGVLMPACTQAEGVAVVERIRQALAATPIPLDAHTILTVTASIGLASSDDAGHALRLLLSQADTALYEAKNAGRNRVVALAMDAPPVADGGIRGGALTPP